MWSSDNVRGRRLKKVVLNGDLCTWHGYCISEDATVVIICTTHSEDQARKNYDIGSLNLK